MCCQQWSLNQWWGNCLFNFFMMPTLLFSNRGVTIRWAMIQYISRYTTHDTVYDTIQKQLIYYQWKKFETWDMCRQHDQYCYIKTVILARNSEQQIKLYVIYYPYPDIYVWPNVFFKIQIPISSTHLHASIHKLLQLHRNFVMAWISNHIIKYSVGCNYVYMSQIPASGSNILICI